MSKQNTSDRKELVWEYKKTPKVMGVYLIRNVENGKCYVASSRDIRARLNRHRMNLKMKDERVQSLQADWTAFGDNAFVFETVDVLEPSQEPNYDPAEDLQVLEELWLEKLHPYGANGYNKPPKV
jgi:group I intron endonuclease